MENLPFIPVPRRANKNGWSPGRQWEFLQRLADCGSVVEAARKVGMSEASAYRLRRHPAAEDFRRAWDAAMVRVWQRVEQVALDRVINGDIEVIEREGRIVATRKRPCSDRLMIHMLKEQARRAEAQVAALAAENAALLAEARRGAWPIVDGKRVAPPAPAPVDAAAAETAELHACHARADRLPDSTGWNAAEVFPFEIEDAVPRLPMPETTLVPASGRFAMRLRTPRLHNGQPTRKVRKTPPGADFSIGAPDAGGVGTAAAPMDYLDRFNPCKTPVPPEPPTARVRSRD
jgi:hypothetical protein